MPEQKREALERALRDVVSELEAPWCARNGPERARNNGMARERGAQRRSA